MVNCVSYVHVCQRGYVPKCLLANVSEACQIPIFTCQPANFSTWGANLPWRAKILTCRANVLKACRFFNFACQKVCQFSNYFSKEFCFFIHLLNLYPIYFIYFAYFKYIPNICFYMNICTFLPDFICRV